MTTDDPPADSVDRRLLEMLVCPRSHKPLTFNAARTELISKKERLAFPIRDGIPIMREDEARKIGEDEARTLD